MLDIPEGAYGRTRAGEKVGPVTRKISTFIPPGFYYITPQEPQGYYASGHRFDNGTETPRDLVAIWQDGPVVTETVTKTRIVPGVYDRITVNDAGKAGMVGLWLNNGHYFSADQLDAAAAVLSALAKGLRDVD